MNDNKKPWLLDGEMYQYNLGWLIDKILSFEADLATAIDLKTIKYADPIQWDITTQYTANTVVIDPKTGTAYMSKVPVPSGVALDNTNYWVVIFNFLAIYNKIMDGIASNEGENDYASKDYLVNDLLWYSGILYRVTRVITKGSKFIPGTNLIKTTIESCLESYYGKDRMAQVANDTLNVSGDYTVNAGDIAETADNITVHALQSREIDVDGSDSVHIDGASTLNVGGMRTEVYAGDKSEKVYGTFIGEYKNARLKTESPSWFVEFPDKTVNLSDIQPLAFIYADSVGCKGDGVTDDTAALQAALDTYDTVFLNPGKKYLITAIQVHKCLDGRESTLVLKSAESIGIKLSNSASLENVVIDAEAFTGTYVSLCYHSENVVYKNVTILNPAGLSFSCSNSKNIKYIGCIVRGSKTQSGFWCFGNELSDGERMNILYDSCIADSNAFDGFNICGYGVDVLNCIATGNGTNPPSGSLGASGIYLDHQTSARDITIVNCKCDSNTERGISIESPSQRVLISECRCSKNALSGIHVAPSQRISIRGCICNDNGSWSGTSGQPVGYYKAGIDFSTVLGLIVTGNQCFETRPSNEQTQEYGIQEYGNANTTAGVVANNSCAYNKIGHTSINAEHLPSGIINNAPLT